MELEFTVTEDHILKGEPRQAYNCAVAECLKEMYSMASVSGSSITIEHNDTEYMWNTCGIEKDKEWIAFGAFVVKFDDIVAPEFGDPCIPEKRELYKKWEGHLTFKLGKHTDERPV